MRKLISLFLILSLNAYGQSEPITRLKLEGSGTYVPGSSIQVPNNSATKINGSTSRLETGNTNLLSNPSFEATVPSTGWTLTNATSAANTSFKLEGAQSLQVTPTVAGGGIKQSMTLNAASLLGSQGVIEVPVRTSGTDVKVCFLANSVRTYCTDVPAFDSTAAFKTIVTPITFDGTSNGIEVYSTGTSVFIVDEIKIGRGLPLQNVNGAKLVGTVMITGCASPWSTTSTTFASYATQTGCTYTVSGQALAPSTNIPAIKFASLPAGEYRLEYEGNTQAANSNLAAYYQFSDGTNTAREISAIYAASSATASNSLSQSISYSTSQSNVTIEIKGKADSGGTNKIYGITTFPGVIKVWYFPPESKIYSQASQDYDWTAYTPTFTGFGTTTSNECFHKREGSDLLVRCKFTSGITTATEARVSLPNSLISANTNIIPSITATGMFAHSGVEAYEGVVLSEPNVGYFTFGKQGSGTGGLTKLNGNSLASIGASLTLYARIPIQGWQDYGVIVGSFAGIEKCANDYECTDMFSATITNGNAISNQNIPWLSTAIWSPAGTLTLTFNTNLKDGTSALSSNMNCWAIPSTQGQRMSVNTISTTQVIFENRANDGTSNSTPTLAYVYCQKGTNDYKPKTAKVASSIGVPTVPGITTSGTGNNIDTFSVSYGATSSTVCSTASTSCAYNDALGTSGNYVYRTGSTGVYTLFTSKTYAKLKCVIGGFTSGLGASINGPINCSSCSSSSFNTYSTAAIADTYGTLYCIGSY